jgi:hypothetical protein
VAASNNLKLYQQQTPRETLENQADLRDNDHVIVGAHWGDGQ